MGGGGVVNAGGGRDDALGAVDELGVGGAEVDHQVAEGRSGADHHAGGEHVQNELGGGSSLHAGGTGEDLGAGGGGDGDLGGAGELGVGDAAEADGEGAALAGVGDGAEDVGRATGGGDADEGVLCGEVAGNEVGGSAEGGVLGFFRGLAEGAVTTGDDALDTDAELAADELSGGNALAAGEGGGPSPSINRSIAEVNPALASAIENAKQAEAIAKDESRTMSELFREAFRAYRAERALAALREAAEYGASRNPHGYTEEDVPRIVKEVRAEMRAERERKSRIAG